MPPSAKSKRSARVNASTHDKTFFSSVPDGVFNLLSSFMELKEFDRPHGAMQSS